MSDFVLPTRIAVHRYQQMKVEAILNTPYVVTDELTPVQVVLGGADIDETIAALDLPGEDAEIAEDILHDALGGGDLDEIYGPRGGVLSILLPTAGPDDDLIWQAVEQEAPGAMTQNAFVNAAHELFGGLTPAQVWAGAGKNEWQLAQGHLPSLWNQFKDEKFATPGAANTAWLSKLRLWSYNPAQGFNGRVIDIIRAERDRNLKLRLDYCTEKGIDTPFAELDE
jgi:hypothetical protein